MKMARNGHFHDNNTVSKYNLLLMNDSFYNRQENKDEMFQKLLLFMTIICSGVKWCHSKIINICTTGSPPVTRPPITRDSLLWIFVLNLST